MKIKKLPKTRMEAMVDRVVNVPVEDCDIQRTLDSLPRTLEESAVIPIQFKRKKDMKNVHASAFVRPLKIYKCLIALRDAGNPYYVNTVTRCIFCDVQFELDDKILDHVEECQKTFEERENDAIDDDGDISVLELSYHSTNSHHSSDEEESDNEIDLRNDVSCILPKNPEEQIVVNTKDVQVEAKMKDSVSGKTYPVAPGEGRIPTNILREHNCDVKAFPAKHPSSKFGMDHDRKVKLSRQQYLKCRLLNYTDLFSKDNDYVFMAGQIIERAALEAQIDISVQKGVMKDGPGGTKVMKTADAFSVFQKISGSPKFWQMKRNNLLAMISALGPFQFFFTLSCAEMRWSEVIAHVLRKKGFTVEVLNQYQEDEEILVDGINLLQYMEDTKQSKHELLRDEMFLITRMFEHRVKSFVRNILMDQGDQGMHVEYFTYRVEFQMRGLPHIHGVAWMEKKFLEQYMKEDEFDYDLDKLPELIDQFVTCEIPEDTFIKKLVEELQSHSHSKTCKKKGSFCRFDYPKLPSNRTLIARPKDKDDNDESSMSLSKVKEIKKKVNFTYEYSFNLFLSHAYYSFRSKSTFHRRRQGIRLLKMF